MLTVPWLPEGRTVLLPGRGEVFYRHHRHANPDAPTLLLLHGWTASADLQFFTAYEALAEHWSFVAIDHRGHGRGLRTLAPFELEDVADDAAALVELLGVGPVVTVGYSMGGPVSMLLAHRHPHLVRGVVVQATALEWSATRRDRAEWRLLPALGWGLRSWLFPRALRWGVRRSARKAADGVEGRYAAWAAAEFRRNDVANVLEAGRALARYDARPWAGSLGVPAGLLLTTRDRLVPPAKQRALAEALRAEVVELRDDHLCTITSPAEYAAATVRLVQHVLRAG